MNQVFIVGRVGGEGVVGEDLPGDAGGADGDQDDALADPAASHPLRSILKEDLPRATGSPASLPLQEPLPVPPR
jgi:hypothetical protein